MKSALLFNCLLIWATLFTGPTTGFRLMEKIKSGLSNGIDNSVNALKLSLGLIAKPPVAAPVDDPEEFLLDAMVPDGGFEEEPEEEEEMASDLPHGIHGHRIGLPAPPHTYQHHHLPSAEEDDGRWDAPPRHPPHGGHHHHNQHHQHHPKLPPTPEEEPSWDAPHQLRPHGLHHVGGGHHGGLHHHGGPLRPPNQAGRGMW